MKSQNKKTKGAKTGNGSIGRPLHDFWEVGEFDRVNIDGKLVALCFSCGAKLKNTSKLRLQRHMNICKQKTPSKQQSAHSESAQSCQDPTFDLDLVKVEILDTPFQSDYQQQTQANVTTSITSNNSSDGTSYACSPSSSAAAADRAIFTSPPRKNKKEEEEDLISRYIDGITPLENDEIDISLGELIFGCNIPFNVVESNTFKGCLKKLRPSYTPPCRSTLSTTLLVKVHQKLIADDAKVIGSGRHSVLLIDDLKNPSANTKKVVTMLHTTSAPGHSIFLESFDFSEIEQTTTEELQMVCEKSVEIAKQRYNVDVFAVVSESASNMVQMGSCINIIHTTCNTHIGNLLVKDFLVEKAQKLRIHQATNILKEFKKPNLEQKLITKGGTEVVLPNDTKWTTYRRAIDSFLKNLPIMKQMVEEPFNSDGVSEALVSASSAELLFKNEFVKDLKSLHADLDPVCGLINKAQTGEFSIADAVEEWKIILNNTLEKGNELSHRKILERTAKNNAFNVHSITANYLNPKYRGQFLSSEERLKVDENLISVLSSSAMDSVIAYDNKVGIFSLLHEKLKDGDYKVATYWHFAKKHHMELAEYAEKLLSIPASSAQLDRVFSNWSMIHSEIKNCSDSNSSKMLLNIYHSLRIKDSNKSET